MLTIAKIPEMSFLEDIKLFCKGKLKSVETTVKTADGREVIESKDRDGKVQIRVTGSGLGFIRDQNPDLQVATIVPGVSLGSQDVAHEIALLKQHNVTHILNLATGIDNSFEGSFIYKKISIFDLPDEPIRDIFEECFQFMDSALEQNGHVFVHCNAGVSRSATIVIAYIMKTHHLRYVEALGHVKSVRSAVRPNYGFTRQLMDYDAELLAGLLEQCEIQQ